MALSRRLSVRRKNSWSRDMEKDPVVQELHRIREQMLEEHGGLDGLVEHLRQMQAEMPQRVVSLPPKPPARVQRKIS